MTIYSRLDIGGTTYDDAKNLKVKSTTGKSNAASTFTCNFDNQDGRLASTFTVGQEVVIYADLDTNPATTKIFTGILENINFKGKGQSGTKGEQIQLSGRDYSARLQDATVQPVTYQNTEISEIVTDIMSTNVQDVTVTNVDVTDTTLQFIQFTQKNVFDALKELAELAGFIFYVDVDKDLHFEEAATVATGTTLDNSNVLKTSFKETRKQMVNKVWVYGERQQHGKSDSFTADGAGSVFTLARLGIDPTVTVGGVEQTGEVFGQAFGSGVEYLFDQPNKSIVFVSGGSPGIGYSAIPGSLAAVAVSYFYTTPIVKLREDTASVDTYGPKTQIIVDKNITDPQLAKDMAKDIVDRKKDPITQGNVDVFGVPTLAAGQTVIVNLPDEDQSSKTYEILEVSYDFDQKKAFSNSVVKVKVSQKINDILDTIKDLFQDVKALQTGDIETADIVTRLLSATGSVGVRVNKYFIKTRTLGDSYIPGHPDHYTVGNLVDWSSTGSAVNTLLVGDRRAVWVTSESGGTFN